MKLEEYKDKAIKWQRQKRLYDGLRSVLEVSGQDYSKPKVSKSQVDDIMAGAVAKLLEREKLLEEARLEMVSAYYIIQENIEDIEDEDERAVLEAKYLNLDINKTPIRYDDAKTIAEDLGWSESKTYKVLKSALRNYK